MARTTRSHQFATRARNAVSKFNMGGNDYETTMNLLTEYASRVQRMNSRAGGGAVAQTLALNEIYALMDCAQRREPTTIKSQYGELLEPIGDGCYITRSAPLDY